MGGHQRPLRHSLLLLGPVQGKKVRVTKLNTETLHNITNVHDIIGRQEAGQQQPTVAIAP